VSNYRVRQVLALGTMPDRQLRLLIALATWMDDDTRTVKVGFGALTEAMGRHADTARKARKDATTAGRITYIPGRGRGHRTIWTLACLPEKGVQHGDTLSGHIKGGTDAAPLSAAVKGGQPRREKGGNPANKRGDGQRADLQRPVHGLDLKAKPLAVVGQADPPGPAANGEPQAMAGAVASVREMLSRRQRR
jgi:hypothetical protein